MILVLSQRSSVRQVLSGLLSHADLPVATAYTVDGVADLLRAHNPSAVVCDSDFPDGGWRAILALIEILPKPPLLVVTSSEADDRLWAEVLNLGGYDVLAQPMDAAEVRRVLVHAHRASMAESLPHS